MPRSVGLMKTHVGQSRQPALSATVAAEDLACGDMVAVLHEIAEYPSFLWCSDPQLLSPEQPVRVRWRPLHPGTPLKVVSICLPFVFLRDPRGNYQTIDVRSCDLVRLHRDYARLVWRKLGKRS